MKKYKCIKEFIVNKYDEKFLLTEKTMKIEKGTIWNMTNEVPYTNGDYHLERYTNTHFIWIDIIKEHLKEFFIEVEDEEN